MTSPRWTGALAALAATIVIAGCGADEGSSRVDGDGAPDDEKTRSGCEAEVELAGEVTASWRDEGFAQVRGDAEAFYMATHERVALSLFAAVEDRPARAVLTVGEESYTTRGRSGVLEVDTDGAGARVEATARAIKRGRAVDIDATLECGSAWPPLEGVDAAG